MLETAGIYPGLCLIEATELSEGRGTTLPFEVCGAPDLNIETIGARLTAEKMPGVVLRPCLFEPTSGKHAQRPCRGYQLHITDRDKYKPYLTSLKLLQTILRHPPESWAWKPPPYEYEFEKRPIDLILGDADIRRRIENLEDLTALERQWQEALAVYWETARPSLIYD